MKLNHNAQVTLVGAGPGDPGLISLSGVKALQEAKVVLYDALVNTEILKWASDAKKIFVGKRLGYKRYEQSEINYLLLTHAMESGKVVRLKGGDSYIFGRGSDEIDFLEAFNVKTKVIPGISSSTSATTSIGIPLTKRGVSEGFWIITGTKEYEAFSKDIELAAQSNSTIIILMGMRRIERIMDTFMSFEKHDLPVAVVQNATRENQASVIGSVSDIALKVKDQGIANPAVIILGDVVKESAEWKEEIANVLVNKI